MAPETHAGRSLVVVGFVLACLPFAYLVAAPRPLAVDWDGFGDLPFAAERQVELATGRDVVKDRSLSLVCAPAGDLRLVLRARLEQREGLRPSQRARATLRVGEVERRDFTPDRFAARVIQFERVELVRLGVVDTFVTEPLAAAQLDRLAALFGPSPPKEVAVSTFRHGIPLTGAAVGEAVRALAARCPRA